MRRRPRYKRAKRSTVKSNYIIVALLCLIVLNIGAMGINVYKNKENKLPDTNVNERSSLVSFFNNIWNSVVNYIPTFKPEANIIEENLLIDEELNEFEESKDYFIIERLEEYESLIIIKDSDGISTVENVPSPLNLEKIKADRSKPYIAIYHTHASEAYQPLKEDVYHVEDRSKNVIGIGDIIATVLDANNHKNKHIETYHDTVYNQSYARSLNTINKIKEEDKNIKVFIDIHRDGFEKDSPYYEKFMEKTRTKINGIDTATFSLVVGPQTPNYDEVLNFAKYIKAVSDTLYPGLCTGIIVKPAGKFNLYSSNHATLIEVGSNFNTVDEANEAAKLIGEILSIVFNSLQE